MTSLIKMDRICLDYFHYANRKTLKKTIVKSVIHLFRRQEKPFSFRRALDGISALFSAGDRIALIGKNGSGKSTLLRVLSGIYLPTGGDLMVQGSVSSILDINVGLNPEATGYENMVLMGVLQGNTRKQMKSKFKEIEEFTELGDYLRLPVRTYSDGMRLRLAFSIATCMESDIMIIDEVIGVGDQKFMEKAQEKMKEVLRRSQILVLTSHSIPILECFCNKAMILDQGKCIFFGDLQEGIDLYRK